MANIKSAKKRIKVIDRQTLENKSLKTMIATYVKKYKVAVDNGEKEVAAETYKATVKKLDKAVAQGLLHKNAAARKKSQYTRKLNSLNA